MSSIYGHKWVSAYGPQDDGTWAVGLSGYTPEQIGRGLRACLDRNDPWPPSLPEFRALCKPGPRENAAAYRDFPPALEHKPSADQKLAAHHLLAELRRAVR